MTNIKLSIVVPCYNEENNILLILERFKKVIHRDDIEVLLINNGSTDNSKHILMDLVPKFYFARVITIEKNKGYGFGIISGLKEARGEFIGYTHADLQTDPRDVLEALEIIEGQNEPKNCYVKGNRKGRSVYELFFSWGMSFFVSLCLGFKLWDINAQPNIFPKSFFNSLNNFPNDFTLDLFFMYMAKKQGLNINRFNVLFPGRIHGKSCWNNDFNAKWLFIKRTIFFSLKLRRER